MTVLVPALRRGIRILPLILLVTWIGALFVPVKAHSTDMIVHTPGPFGPLEGAYLSATGKSASTVLIIPGSGPTDRDGNNPLGVRTSIYRYLAQGLAKAGINSLRIDKRGMFGSARAIPDANKVSVGDYADDVHAWIKLAQDLSSSPCIWLLGHSEGALVALLAARKKAPICGLILVAAPGRPFGDLLRQQLRANPANAPLLDDAMKAITALESGDKVDVAGLHPALYSLFSPQVQGFISDAMSYDPASLIANVTVPVLIMQGDADLQVSTEDARRLHEAGAHSRLVLLPQVNHVLKYVSSDDRAVNLASYSDPALPLAPGVIEAVTDFIASHQTNN